ncbi:MAG: anthranilate synthase component I [Actinomycetota bacterium]
MFNITREQFNKLSHTYNLIPVYREYMVDTETPASLFLKIKRRKKPVFLLESIEGPRGLSRYSIIGIDYSREVSFSRGVFTVKDKKGNGWTKNTDRPMDFLKGIMGKIKVYGDPGLGHFIGGLVGYISYDMVSYFEKIPLAGKAEFPEMLFYSTNLVIVFDHYNNTMKIIATLSTGEGLSSYEAYCRSTNMIEALEEDIYNSKAMPGLVSQMNRAVDDISFESNFDRHEFLEAVEKAKGYINSGDAFQVVLSQRFGIKTGARDFDIYRQLRTTNPSPYMFFMDFENFKLIGSSPEPLVKVKGDKILTCPIAGTRRRGRDESDDKAIAEELLGDEKERAEHNMLVDLARNDLGRVSEYGSVEVKKYMDVGKYSHVMHLVSVVEGKLMAGKDVFDALRSVFPAGTLSGAPKVRAMQIISELENQRRGPYGGAVGYFGYEGSMDFCITIRTALLKGGTAYVQAGAGIVYDSVAENEYEETVNKAGALFRSIKMSGIRGGIRC